MSELAGPWIDEGEGRYINKLQGRDVVVRSTKQLHLWSRRAGVEQAARLRVLIADDSSGSGAESSAERHVADLFGDLCEVWRVETVLLSSVEQIALHPAYQRIIGLGSAALPYIFRELAREPGHWFWALRAITGDDPARGEQTLDGATQRWLRWAEERGIIPGARRSDTDERVS